MTDAFSMKSGKGCERSTPLPEISPPEEECEYRMFNAQEKLTPYLQAARPVQ
jgi:hypothetical protein